MSFILSNCCKKESESDPVNVIDVKGNTYNVIRIGKQLWMKENLKTTKYNDGTFIPNVTDSVTWAGLSTGALCWYNNDAATYKATYGALYNWYTVNTGKLYPAGWHVPSDAEWKTLEDYLGGYSVAGGILKEAGTAHWLTPNTGATNQYGFTALPGGSRSDDGSYAGLFYSITSLGFWWSSTEVQTIYAAVRIMSNSNTSTSAQTAYNKPYGFSVRCLRDN